MQTIDTPLHKSPKAKKIEDIVKPDATMRLHQRLFDRRRKHHIDVKEENSTSPGTSLSAYLIPTQYHRKPPAMQQLTPSAALATTAPIPVVRYSEITRDLPEETFLATEPGHARSFMDRVAQRYRVFVSQHKPFYYSLNTGTASGWLKNPRAQVALAGSALALLMFFIGTPSRTPTGPDNPVGKNPIVIQDTSRESNSETTEQIQTSSGASSPEVKPGPGGNPTISAPATPPAQSGSNTYTPGAPTNGGGYGSGPTTSATTPSGQSSTPSQNTPTSTNLIQDVIQPTPVTVPGQDIQVDDKRILQTSDTTITIN